MKEASGEANMTVVTIVLIAVVLGAGTLIVTNIVNKMNKSKPGICITLGGVYDGANCICPTGSAREIIKGSELRDNTRIRNCNNIEIKIGRVHATPIIPYRPKPDPEDE